MTKHTPGPWKIGTAIRYRSLAVFDNNATDNGAVVDAVCLISPLEDVNETDEANAKLIAAAPELLEALEQCLSRINPKSKDTWDLKAILIANQVIKKATE